MRVLRGLLALGTVTILCPSSVLAVDGVNEINQTSILAAGGYPYTIPAPGSYRLTGNLAPPAATGALVLGPGVSNVEIDLNGFTITSPGGGGAIGIDSAGNTGLTVRRGVIAGFGGAGISAGANSKVIEMKLTSNGVGVGSASTCLIVMSTVTGSTGDGIQASACKVENNIVLSNSGTGIIGPSTLIVHNQIQGNTGGGILALGGDTIQENIIQANSPYGIADAPPPAPPPPVPPPAGPPPRNVIIGNSIANNLGGPGISLMLPASISQNSVSANFTNGIVCGAACVVNDNSVESNNISGAPASGGVTVAAGSVVHANTISYNTGFGLTLPAPATASYTNNTIIGNAPGPNVVSPATITGGFGNVCFPVVCP